MNDPGFDGLPGPAYTVAPMAPDPHRDRAWDGVGTGWAVTSTLIGGMIVLGGGGYLLDRLLGTAHVLTGVGFILGGAAGTYIVYLRYGREEHGAD